MQSRIKNTGTKFTFNSQAVISNTQSLDVWTPFPLPVLHLCLFFFWGCVGSLLLRAGFLQSRRAGATLRCGARASHCGGFSLLRSTGSKARRLQQLWHLGSVGVACRLQSTGSVVVANGLSCSEACGIFPDQGSNLCPCTGRRILNHCATREACICVFDIGVIL